MLPRASLFLLCLALLLAPVGQAAKPKRLSQFHLTSWSQEHGLPGGALSLSQSPSGALQVGTSSGFRLFDGLRFTTPQPLDDLRGVSAIILCQAIAPDGSLWIGTNGGGLYHLSGTNLRAYTSNDGLPSTTINALHFAPSGTLWIGTNRGLVSFAHNRFSSPLLDNSVWSLADHPAGGLLLATFGQGLLHLSGTTLTPVVGLPSREARTIYRSPRGALWVSFPGVGLFQQEGDHWRHIAPANPGLRDVWSLLEDSRGHLWIAGGAAGLSRWDGATLDTLTESTGLPHPYVLTLFRDAESNIWAGARTGLMRFRDDELTRFTTSEGFPTNSPGPLLEITQDHWLVGSQNTGAYLWQPSTATTRPIPTLANHRVFALHRDPARHIWLGTDHGLAELSGSTARLLPAPMVFTIASAGPGRLWLGTLRGLCLHNGTECQPHTAAAQIPTRPIFAIHTARNGALWLGYGEGLLCRVLNNKVRCWTDADGLEGADIFALAEDDRGDIWVASMSGLARVSGDRLSWLRSAQGLPFNPVYGLLHDGGQRFWLASGDSLFATTLPALRAAFTIPTSSIAGHLFTRFDGMPPAVAGASPSASLSTTGEAWFPTTRGAIQLPAHSPSPPRSSPPPVIEEILVDGQLSPSAIPAGARNLEIHYTAYQLATPEKTRFEYQLTGYDTSWIPAGTRRVAYYTGLPPGTYTFRVRTANAPPSIPLTLTQQPFFWQTNTFRLTLLATALLLIWLWNRWRLAQAQQRFAAVLAERARIARDLHDTILGDFTGFSLRLGAFTLPNQPPVAPSTLEPIVTRMEQSLREARSAIHLLRSTEEDDQGFLTLLQNVCQDIARAHSIAISFNTTGQPAALSITTRDCLYRVIVECVRNAVKHSRATAIHIDLSFAGNTLAARVSDNGCGFNTTAPARSNSFGLRGMHERATAAGAALNCESSPAGTTISLTCPT